ncbi:MAG: putative GH43/DUF377 family glycosyl hydrolase [Verrucomicrobiales bacterium]|jgi:predicted GH43/DUF377 family glycosyl hydrolase
MKNLILGVGIVSFAALGANAREEPRISFQEIERFESPQAHQAVAVDATSFFAITNRSISKHDKFSGELQKTWTAEEDSPVIHMNGGIVVDGRLYCANSSWPKAPLHNTVEILDAETLEHIERRTFPETEGALNWIERHRGSWWLAFVFFEEDVKRSQIVRYDDKWEVTGKWILPDSVIERLAPHSNSGGAFGPNGRLYLTGHDHGELYVMENPIHAWGELTHLATVKAPIAGQGIAWDRSDIGILYGIVRKTHEVVKMRLSHPDEYTKLKRPVEWVRDEHNPILPPRKGEFDSTRCMNPWVIRSDDDTYRLFYSGGDDEGMQRIGVATASVQNPTEWTREGPLFETGAAGAFDARWCVLPHVVQHDKNQWRLYYTGNAGRGSGLSAFPGMGVATSSDGLSWERNSDEPVLKRSGEHGDPDAIGIAGGSLIQVGNEWRFYYTGAPTVGRPHALNQQKTICLAVSVDGGEWIKRGAVMLRDPNRDYEDIGVAGPVVQMDDDGLFRMWYSAIGSRWGFYSICYAESKDGVHWSRGAEPEENLQLTPAGDGWEKQMVEYPSVIREGNHLRLFYCGNGYGNSGIGTAVSKVATD